MSYDDAISLWHLDPSQLTANLRPSSDSNKKQKRSGTLDGWVRGKARPSAPPLDAPKVLSHNNQTGKWVTLFRACWQKNPSLEPHFSIGSMTRHAEIYDQHGRRLVRLHDPDWITAVPAVTALHPISPARMATGNGSGRCALWAPC